MQFLDPRMKKNTLQQELEDQELKLRSSFLGWNCEVLRVLRRKGSGRSALFPKEAEALNDEWTDVVQTTTSPRAAASM